MVWEFNHIQSLAQHQHLPHQQQQHHQTAVPPSTAPSNPQLNQTNSNTTAAAGAAAATKTATTTTASSSSSSSTTTSSSTNATTTTTTDTLPNTNSANNYSNNNTHHHQQQQQQQQQQQSNNNNNILDNITISNNTNINMQNSTNGPVPQQQQQQPQPQPQPQQNHQQQQPQPPVSTAAAVANKRHGLVNPIISERCCAFKITPEERQHRDFQLEQSKILKEIMQKTNTKIEVTSTKDGALNFCIIGKEQNLKAAKNLVLNDFQTSVTLTVAVPKAIHGRLLGPKGARLGSIQDETQTKITIPRKEEGSDIIKIVGLKSNAENAVRSIQKYVREFAGKTVEKVTVEKNYLLFVTGPYNENLKRWEELGAKVASSSGLLPSNNDRESGQPDEVTFTIIGETSIVNQIKEEILQIYEDKKKKCTTVNMEVKKAQHKYILGPGGQNLRILFAKTGVSVELPHESDSETITLRGERTKIAPALSELYLQAHSETDEYIEVESWLHKYLIGPRKTNYIDFKARGVDVKSLEDKIKLHGPPTEVENIRDALEAEFNVLRKTIIRKDIRVEPRIHGYIIGKAGATVDQIREDSGAHVLVPKNDEASQNITLEGTAEAVAIAEEKINAIAKKYESSRKLVIDQQLHGSIIGRGGEKIRSIREKFSHVVFTFPEQGSKNNEITILGPTEEVEECYKYLDEFHKQLQESNHQVKVPIKQDITKYLNDAQSAIKRIKMDHKVKIDLFISKDATTNQQQGDNQKYSKKQAEAGVTAQNPTESSTTNQNSDAKPSKKSNKNKSKQVQQPHESSKVNGVANDVKVNGSAPDQEKLEGSYAIVIGKEEYVEPAKAKLIKLLEELATTTEFEVKMAPKLRVLLGPKTKVYRNLLDEFQHKVVISFAPGQRHEKQPKQQANNTSGGEENGLKDATNINGSTNGKKQQQPVDINRVEIVKIRGPKNIAKKAAKNFETLIAEYQEKLDKSYQLSTNVDTALIEKIMSSDKLKLNKIREAHSVKLMIPDKRDTNQLNCVVVGYEKNVQAAMNEFKELVKDVEERTEETIEIPSQFHPRLIGAGGRNVKKIMEDFKVGVKFARQGDPDPNSVILSGKSSAISAAKTHMLKQAEQYRS